MNKSTTYQQEICERIDQQLRRTEELLDELLAEISTSTKMLSVSQRLNIVVRLLSQYVHMLKLKHTLLHEQQLGTNETDPLEDIRMQMRISPEKN